MGMPQWSGCHHFVCVWVGTALSRNALVIMSKYHHGFQVVWTVLNIRQFSSVWHTQR